MSDHSPAISVLVPVFNVERYLETCLDSLRAQTFKDFEVICINDGSTDSSKIIIERYCAQDERFKLLDKTNSGYGDSMNQGLAQATGDYIAILESDDFFEPDALESLYSEACASKADVVKADFYLYWSVPTEKSERFEWVTSLDPKLVNPLDYTDLFYRKPSIWSALYKSSFLQAHDIGFLPTPGASYQDASFNFKVWLNAKRVALLDKAILYYRQDNEASSVNAPGKLYCVCDEYAEIYKALVAQPDKKELLDPVYLRMRFDTYMWNYERLSSDLAYTFLDRMQKDFSQENEALLAQSSLDSWKLMQREFIIKDKERFHVQREAQRHKQNRLDRLKMYWKMGGLKLICRLCIQKMKVRHHA